jgi:hypothetical protein
MTVTEDRIIRLDPIEPDQIIPASDVSFLKPQVKACTSSKASSWGLDRINQCQGSCDDKTTKQDAKGVTVFIIDSGIHGDHSEFKGIIDPNDECHFSAFDNLSPLLDTNGHG